MSLNTSIDSYSPDLNNLLNNYTANREKFYSGQYGKITDFLDRYRQGIFGQESLPALNERLGKEVGLPALRESAQATTRTLNEIPSTYTNATKGYDVSSNALSRIVGTKQAAYAPVAQQAQTAYQNAQDIVNQKLGFEQTQQAKELLPFQSEQQMLTDYQAREASGFTTEMEAKLNGYLEKMRQGVQLSTTEATLANQYAIAKLNYDQAIKVAEIGAASSKYQVDALNKWG